MALQEGLVLRICVGNTCGKQSAAVEKAARTFIQQSRLTHVIAIEQQACFGKCFLGPNLLVERWRNGKMNQKAMYALASGVEHPDMRFEHSVRPEDLPRLIRWHLMQWPDLSDT